MNIQRHFTVSVYIVHKDKLLLHLHKRSKIMLPLGGHIEVNELPEEACIREAKEESGLNISLHNSDINKLLRSSSELTVEKVLINPMHTVLCKVNSEHYHIDFVYYATAKSFETKREEGESNLLKWVAKEELKDVINIPHNVLVMANEALELLTIR